MGRLLRAMPNLLLLLTFAGCGCDAVGRPAVELELRDQRTGEALGFGGVDVRYEHNGNASSLPTIPDTMDVPKQWIYGSGGTYRIEISRTGYAIADTTVHVGEGGGSCDSPRLRRVVLPLSPIAAALAN